MELTSYSKMMFAPLSQFSGVAPLFPRHRLREKASSRPRDEALKPNHDRPSLKYGDSEKDGLYKKDHIVYEVNLYPISSVLSVITQTRDGLRAEPSF
jgi:hypothetical protein